VVIQANGRARKAQMLAQQYKKSGGGYRERLKAFRKKTIPFIPAFKHRQDCLVMQDGPCTCGLEEVLEDEAREELEEVLKDEAREEYESASEELD
jgi:hypothetical protein